MFKVLVISHSAIQTTYQRKFDEIAKQHIGLRVLVPSKWVENTLVLYMLPRKDKVSWHTGKVTFPGYGSRFFFINGIIEHFRDFRPDIIHLEEEPWSMSAIQTIVLRKIFCPQSKLIFRTSLSIPAKQRLNFMASRIERITFKESDYAFILSERAGEILRQKGYDKGMKVSPNGIDSQIFRKMNMDSLKARLGIKDGDIVIGYVGRLMKMKGLDILLKAFSLLIESDMKNLCLLIVGSGEFKEEMVQIASQLGISEKMIMVDAVPAEDVPKYINCMDIFVLPSITTPGWVEFFGRTLVEAMMCEVPVVGSSSGEIPNVIDNAGLIFNEGDETNLSDKLARLIENTELRHSLIQRGKERAFSLYTWESIGKDTYDTYCKVLYP